MSEMSCIIYFVLLMYRIYLNIGPGVYFLPASFDLALKRGRHLNVASVYNKIIYCTLEFSLDPHLIFSLQLLLISSQPSQRCLA